MLTRICVAVGLTQRWRIPNIIGEMRLQDMGNERRHLTWVTTMAAPQLTLIGRSGNHSSLDRLA
jgi:hypothetical protein